MAPAAAVGTKDAAAAGSMALAVPDAGGQDDGSKPAAAPAGAPAATPPKEAQQPGEDGEDDTANNKKGCLAFLGGGPSLAGAVFEDQRLKHPLQRPRCWEFGMTITSFENITKETVKFFLTVTVESDNPIRHRSRVSILPRYTSCFTLKKGQSMVLDKPSVMFDKKYFNLPYKELEKHVVKIDMWEMSSWTFNNYYGVRKKKLSEIARKDPTSDWVLAKKLTRLQQEERRKYNKPVNDVAIIGCIINLEEVFDFTLECDNWEFMLNLSDNPSKEEELKMEKVKSEDKRLTFIIPKDRKSLPGQWQLTKGSTSRTTEWNREKRVFFWPTCGSYVFRGTRTHLQNAFFIVTVYSGKKKAVAELSSAAAEAEKYLPGQKEVGRSLMNLLSVLEISVFQGKVKKFTKEEKDYNVGSLSGNVKCTLRSKTLPPTFDEQDLTRLGIQRPIQPRTTTAVSQLKSFERHLVIYVRKCEHLPSADFDSGLSDPFLRISWDGVIQKTAPKEKTVTPVFKQFFYFPVRMVFTNLKCGSSDEQKYLDTIIKYELKSRNKINLEVWDDDNSTNADFLGGTQLMLEEILNVRRVEKVTMQGRCKKEKGEDDDDHDESAKPARKQWFEEEEDCRFYDGSRTPLQSSIVSGKGQPLIHFEAFFYPDWSDKLRLALDTQQGDAISLWLKKEKEWDKSNNDFREEHWFQFSESIGNKPGVANDPPIRGELLRRFPCLGRNPLTTSEVPLMAFISPIIIPEQWSFPATLLHWMHCITFDLPTYQTRTGLIHATKGWNSTEFFLQARKGTPGDHSVLLCSLLSGCKKDAYVCKGTIMMPGKGMESPKLVEHVWVMTREEGWVTFWETCTRQVYHLPMRCKNRTAGEARRTKKKSRRDRKRGKKGAADDQEEADAGPEDEEDVEEEIGEGIPPEETQWEEEVEDAHVQEQDMLSLPTIGRMPKPKSRSDAKAKAKGRDALQEANKSSREKSVVAPNKDLLQEKTSVTWLPYDSIEVVFNAKNVWANRQNHHPACITYDFQSEEEEVEPEVPAKGGKKSDEARPKKKIRKWEPLLKPEEESLKQQVVAIAPNVSMPSPLAPIVVENLRKELIIEIKQNIELHRSKKGVDVQWEVQSQALEKQLEDFIAIHELWMYIDPDHPKVKAIQKEMANLEPNTNTIEDPEKERKKFIHNILKPKSWNKKGSPYFDKAGSTAYESYAKSQDDRLDQLFSKIDAFNSAMDNFPVRRGKKFKGVPYHFNTSEHESIRQYLSSCPEFGSFINHKDEDVVFTVECRIFALLGGVLSVWLYIGIQETMPDHTS